MNQWAIQPKAFAAGGEQSVVVCPKPRRIGLRNHAPRRIGFSQQVESKAETDDILDIILTKEQVNHSQVLDSPSPFLCGSPPSRVANPLTQDARFRDEIKLVSSSPITTPLGHPPSSPSSSGRKGGCVRGNFGNSPAVRIEGFDCLDRDSRNCSIPALA
ncbi:hypothetical protein BRARA_B01795 [Brassica rapa]|uniref:Uncharacterized protein n=1 Tax=Brassica campestris TaxID=3711 RepID=A0A398ACW6_BRACM|nr:hypothetical protein BRARA_B01795 [Brassica rapa]